MNHACNAILLTYVNSTDQGVMDADHPAHSFVYPVRSLLAGNILPAAASSPSQSFHGSESSDVSQYPLGIGASGCDTTRSPPPPHTKSHDIRSGHPQVGHEVSQQLRRQNAERAGPVVSPNFRHYPGDDAPTRSFVTASVPIPTKTTVSHESTPPTGDSDNPDRPDTLGFHATTIGPSPSTGDVFFNSAENLGLYPHIPHSQWITTVSMSDTSIVHLPPCSSSHSARSRGTPSHSGNYQADCVPVSEPQSTGHSPTSSQHTRPTPQSTSESLPMSYEGSSDDVGPQSSTSASSGTSASGPGRSHGSNVDSDDTGEEPLTTFRFEHREDDSGHHVVIGREGKLSRCEDEVRTTTFSRDSLVIPSHGLSAHQDSRCHSGIWCARCRTAKCRRRQIPRAPSL